MQVVRRLLKLKIFQSLSTQRNKLLLKTAAFEDPTVFAFYEVAFRIYALFSEKIQSLKGYFNA